jgi:hypothetical protein
VQPSRCECLPAQTRCHASGCQRGRPHSWSHRKIRRLNDNPAPGHHHARRTHSSAAQRAWQCARVRVGRRPWLSGVRLHALRRECAWRQPDVTGERVTILATGKYVAACRRAVVQWPRRAARNVLCIRKEVPAMFANRQTPPRVAL